MTLIMVVNFTIWIVIFSVVPAFICSCFFRRFPHFFSKEREFRRAILLGLIFVSHLYISRSMFEYLNIYPLLIYF